jgi:NitT/TauT family transport system permease protein
MTRSSNLVPMLVVGLVLIALYFPIMLLANYPAAARALARGAVLECKNALECSFNMRSPIIPAPAQLLKGFSSLYFPPTSETSVPYNAFFTGLETLSGLLLASVIGLLPWLVASQTVPIIAIAPMLAVLLGQYGVEGWIPKAIIAAYIAFFPIAIGVSKGLRSPDPIQVDLMKTYNAGNLQTFSKLRFPSSIPYLFTAFKVSVTAALIGAIISESATISGAGLGKMLSENSRASDAVGLWLVMIGSAILGILLVSIVGWLERVVTPWQRNR